MTTLREFASLEEVWREVHAEDPRATVFTTWAWLQGWFAATPHDWIVLAVQDEASGEHVAFIGLSLKLKKGRWRREARELYLAGHPVTNHTGLVCLPGFEDRAVEALAAALSKLRWRKLQFDLMSDPRAQRLASRLGQHVITEQAEGQPSPYLRLPDALETFKAAHLSPKARRELGRRERKAASLGLYQTEAGQDDFGRHLDALLGVHQQRFGPLQARHLRLYRSLFTSCFWAGTLHLHVLWDVDKPVAAQVGFLDHKQRVYHGCQGGWDAEYKDLAPGLMIKLEAIRYAIDKGFDVFDFGRGAHAYKFDLGAEPAVTSQVRVIRPAWYSSLRRSFQ